MIYLPNRNLVLLVCLVQVIFGGLRTGHTQEAATSRQMESMEFHLRSQERTGLLVPLYHYPANVHTNEVYNRLIATKRKYETVPIWVIVNPGSGPGQQVDQNYVKAIDRLQGAGCLVLGYVSTSYGNIPREDIERDIAAWRRLYPQVHGIFFDEMLYDVSKNAVSRQKTLTDFAHNQGFWPTVCNPGADTADEFFQQKAAEVFIVHEGNHWPPESRLHGDFFGGYSDFPPFTRGVLLHSQKELDTKQIQIARKYCRWIYVTDKVYDAKDPKSNPWDGLSKFVEATCEQLAK